MRLPSSLIASLSPSAITRRAFLLPVLPETLSLSRPGFAILSSFVADERERDVQTFRLQVEWREREKERRKGDQGDREEGGDREKMMERMWRDVGSDA